MTDFIDANLKRIKICENIIEKLLAQQRLNGSAICCPEDFLEIKEYNDKIDQYKHEINMYKNLKKLMKDEPRAIVFPK